MMKIDNVRCDGEAPTINRNAQLSVSADVNDAVLVTFTDEVKAICDSPKRSPRKTKRRNSGPRDERRRSKGAQQLRREENLQFLMSENEDGEELDFFNIHEPNFSAFAALFFEQEKMMVWNDFMNRSEEDQHEILNGMKDLNMTDDSDDGSDFEELQMEGDEDQRSVHPAFAADECYKRINRKLRAIIRKRDLPTMMLRKVEGEITDFFTTCPKSVYISQSSNSFSRLLVHTLSQYLNLVSKSFDTEDGVRHTQVENKNVNFTPPSASLADYLEAKH